MADDITKIQSEADKLGISPRKTIASGGQPIVGK